MQHGVALDARRETTGVESGKRKWEMWGWKWELELELDWYWDHWELELLLGTGSWEPL
jgi:hypothetical protein